MCFVFKPQPTPSVAVHGDGARFPVRRIFCVGRNYEAHVREMGKDPAREAPFFFTKPADAVVDDGAVVPYPPLTANFHHEAELVVAIGRSGFDVAEQDAWDLIWGYTIGNELTRRDLQFEARDRGRPWDWGKAFDHSAVCGPIYKASEIGRRGDRRHQAFRQRRRPPGRRPRRADLVEPLTPVDPFFCFYSYCVLRVLHRHAGRRRRTGARRRLRGGDRTARHSDHDDRGAGAMTGLTLHNYFRSSTSIPLRAALNLKGLGYTYVAHHLRKSEQRAAGYLTVNPQGLVPSLVLADGTVLTQSLAIIEYIDETHPEPPLLPAGAVDRARVRALAYAIACEIHPLNNLRVLAR
jgi:hypothetical protein